MEIRVWEARTQKGYTLVQLEGITGISKSTLNNIENGKTSPTLSQLESIASALGVQITDLFDSDLNDTIKCQLMIDASQYFHNLGNRAAVAKKIGKLW